MASHCADAAPVIRFKKSGKTLRWTSSMSKLSPLLEALVSRVSEMEGPFVELDEQSRVVVDDSTYDPEVIDTLIAVLEHQEPDLTLSAGKLFQCLHCTEYFGLPPVHFWKVEQAFWRAWTTALTPTARQQNRAERGTGLLSSLVHSTARALLMLSPLGGQLSEWLGLAELTKKDQLTHQHPSRNVYNFSGLKMTWPIAMTELCIEDAVFHCLELSNVVVANFISVKKCELLDCALDIYGPCLRATSSIFMSCVMPRMPQLQLTDVHLINCSWKHHIEQLSLCRCNIECDWAERIGVMSLRDCTFSGVTVASAESVLFHGLTMLQNCRIRRTGGTSARLEPDPTSILALNCVFAGVLFFLHKNCQSSFVGCTFYGCFWYVIEGSCAIFNDCGFVGCNLFVDGNWHRELSTLRGGLEKHFGVDCKVVSELSDLFGAPKEHLQWLAERK